MGKYDLTQALADDKVSDELTAAFCEYAIKEESTAEESEGFKQFYAHALRTITSRNMSIIAQFAQSPIEKVFLRSLVMGSIKSGSATSIIFHEPFSQGFESIEIFKSKTRDRLEIYRRCSKEAGDGSKLMPFMEKMLCGIGMSSEAAANEASMILVESVLDSGNAFHLVPQARFPDLKDHGTIIADLYAFHPSISTAQLIVECDGYDYHSDPDKFSSDRKRDRAISLSGVQVMRFAGTEIWNDPVSVSVEVFKKLESMVPDPK